MPPRRPPPTPPIPPPLPQPLQQHPRHSQVCHHFDVFTIIVMLSPFSKMRPARAHGRGTERFGVRTAQQRWRETETAPGAQADTEDYSSSDARSTHLQSSASPSSCSPPPRRRARGSCTRRNPADRGGDSRTSLARSNARLPTPFTPAGAFLPDQKIAPPTRKRAKMRRSSTHLIRGPRRTTTPRTPPGVATRLLGPLTMIRPSTTVSTFSYNQIWIRALVCKNLKIRFCVRERQRGRRGRRGRRATEGMTREKGGKSSVTASRWDRRTR